MSSTSKEYEQLKISYSLLAEKFMRVVELSKGHIEVKDPLLWEDVATLYEQLNNHDVLKEALEAQALAMELTTLKSQLKQLSQ